MTKGSPVVSMFREGQGSRGITRGGESRSEGLQDGGCTRKSEEASVMGAEQRGAARVKAPKAIGRIRADKLPEVRGGRACFSRGRRS